MSQRRGAYPPEFRQQMVELVRIGRKPSELAKEFGCHETSISAWVRQAHADELGGGRPDAPLTTAERLELAQLRKQLRQVTMERDILAKATAWFANKDKGRAAIVCFPGIFYRGGAEQKIRQYLVDNNYVESVISLAPNLFFGTTISVSILVLSKHKTDTHTQFIDASGLFKKETNNNALLDTHIDQIMSVFESKENIEHFAQSVPFEKVAASDYNLSVGSYVAAKDNRTVVDIAQLNAELKITVAKIDLLRKDIDAIVAEIEGEEQQA